MTGIDENNTRLSVRLEIVSVYTPMFVLFCKINIAVVVVIKGDTKTARVTDDASRTVEWRPASWWKYLLIASPVQARQVKVG